MKTINGQFNYANVMIDEIEDSTRDQIQGFLDNPSFANSYIAIMPDCHAGAGSCIGFTMQMNHRVIPNVIGVDIGCGMLSCKFNLNNVDLVKLDQSIKRSIPVGFWSRKTVHPTAVDNFHCDEICGIDMQKAMLGIGTLGGGNHFIEGGYDGGGSLWITIHSGSRNFGHSIARYHSKIAENMCEKWGSVTNGVPFLPVDSPEGRLYIEHQKIAVEYAKINRKVMMEEISKILGSTPIDTIESIHNFIDETGMIRKGATPAHAGQRLIIPFNMRDGLAICEGRGNKKYNYSAPHGAGRLMSRTEARNVLNVEDFVNKMRDSGVYTTTANKSTIDESPDAYKDMQAILDNIQETVGVVEVIRPVYNLKSAE